MSATSQSTTTPNDNRLTIDPVPVGMVANGSTKYTVHRVTYCGAYASIQDRVVAVLRGSRGGQYLLIDNGGKYKMSVYNISETTKGWGGGRPFGSPFDKQGGCPFRAEIMAMLHGTLG